MEKPLILVPRLRRYRENHNDHQLQLAQALEEIGRAVVVAEPTARMLQSAIEQCTKNNFRIMGDNHLQKSLKQLLENWSGSSLTLNPEVEH